MEEDFNQPGKRFKEQNCFNNRWQHWFTVMSTGVKQSKSGATVLLLYTVSLFLKVGIISKQSGVVSDLLLCRITIIT